jgi:hypothetical protein
MQVLLIYIHLTLMQNIGISPSNMSYSFAAAALNPCTHYAYGTTTNAMQDLRGALEYMANTETFVTTLQEANNYRRKQGSFSKDLAQKMAYDSNTSSGVIIIFALHSITSSCSIFSLSCCNTMVGYVWWRHTGLSLNVVHQADANGIGVP